MLTRREFLYLSACSAALISIKGSRAFALNNNQRWLVFGIDKDIARFDPLSGKMRTISTPTKGHSFQAFPGEMDRIVGVEKWGRSLSVVDFKTEKVIQSIEPSKPSRYFFGHMAFTRDGKQFISTQTDVSTSKGYLVWYDRETLQIMDEAEFAQGGSHDLSFLPGTDILAITSSGLAPDYKYPEQGPVNRIGPSVVLFFDAKKKEPVRQWDLGTESTFPGHLKVASNGQVYVATSVYFRYQGGKTKLTHGSLYDTNPDQPLREWVIPQEVKSTLKGEMLSLEINEKLNRLALTNPTSKQVLTFDLANRKFLGVAPTMSSGIAWDTERKALYTFEPHVKNKTMEKLNGFSLEHFQVQRQSSHMLFLEAGRTV